MSSEEICAQVGLTNVDLDFNDEDFVTITSLKVYNPIHQKHVYRHFPIGSSNNSWTPIQRQNTRNYKLFCRPNIVNTRNVCKATAKLCPQRKVLVHRRSLRKWKHRRKRKGKWPRWRLESAQGKSVRMMILIRVCFLAHLNFLKLGYMLNVSFMKFI